MERSINASTTMRVPFAKAREVLLGDPGAVMGRTQTLAEGRGGTLCMDLGLDLGAGASVHQNVSVHLGVPRAIDDRVVLPLTWHATGREEWLPTFAGELEVSGAREGTRLELSGTYSVPLGVVGRFGDGVLGRRLVRRSLRSLVEQLAEHIESEIGAHLGPVDGRRAPRLIDLREQGHSEIYIG